MFSIGLTANSNNFCFTVLNGADLMAWNQSFHSHMREIHGYFQKKTKNNSEKSTDQPILCDDCGFSTFNENQLLKHREASCQSLVFNRNRTRARRMKKLRDHVTTLHGQINQ